MDSTVNFSVSSFQLLLAVAFQAWIIIFPLILMRKIDNLTALLDEHLNPPQETSQDGDGDASNS